MPGATLQAVVSHHASFAFRNPGMQTKIKHKAAVRRHLLVQYIKPKKQRNDRCTLWQYRRISVKGANDDN